MVDNTASTVPMLAPCGCPTEACRPFLLSVSIGGDLVRKSTALCLACGNTFTYETLPMPLPTVSESKPLVSALPTETLSRYRQLGATLRTRGEHEAADAILELTELLRSVDAALVSEHEAGLRVANVVREKNAQLAALGGEKTHLALSVVEAAAAVPRWIPVEERLPEPGVDVLVWDALQTTTWVLQLDDFTDGGIEGATHWMPLPAPPSSSEKPTAEGEPE